MKLCVDPDEAPPQNPDLHSIQHLHELDLTTQHLPTPPNTTQHLPTPLMDFISAVMTESEKVSAARLQKSETRGQLKGQFTSESKKHIFPLTCAAFYLSGLFCRSELSQIQLNKAGHKKINLKTPQRRPSLKIISRPLNSLA